jgi:O-antigen ligase
MIWEASFKILEDNWFWGVGLGNFQEKYLEYQKYYPPYLEWAVPHPHNLFLAAWLFGGIISFLSFLLIIALWLRDSVLCEPAKIFWPAWGALLYFIIHGFFDTTFLKNDSALLFWLFLALSLAKKNSRQGEISACNQARKDFKG